jgi:hypothetical protein
LPEEDKLSEEYLCEDAAKEESAIDLLVELIRDP